MWHFLNYMPSGIPIRPTSTQSNVGDNSNGTGLFNSVLSAFSVENIVSKMSLCSLVYHRSDCPGSEIHRTPSPSRNVNNGVSVEMELEEESLLDETLDRLLCVLFSARS